MSAEGWVLLGALIVSLVLLTIAVGGNADVVADLRVTRARNAHLSDENIRLRNDAAAVDAAAKARLQQAKALEASATAHSDAAHAIHMHLHGFGGTR